MSPNTMVSRSKSRSEKVKLEIPVRKIAWKLKTGNFADRVSEDAPVYLAAVLNYLTSEVLDLSGSLARIKKKKQIKPSDLQLVMREDKELSKLLGDVTVANAGVPPRVHD